MEPPRINLTSDLPNSQRAYRTSTTSEAEINKQVQNLLAAGLIKECNSCYSSPVTLAYKRDEKQKTRLCIDYRKLNAICKTDAEPLPRIDSLLDKLNSAKYFSTLDLASGYWLHDKDKEKLAFVTTEGYEIKEGCITPDNQNIETIKKLQPPKNVKQLQLYVPKLPLHVFCDASLKAIGAILKQPDNSGTLHPVSFHSRTLREYEKNYCITELECLAIVDALDKFYYYLHSKKFIIHTDHAALVWLKNVKNLRGRLFRWSLKLSMFDYEVKYLKGTNNVEADMLSRHPIAQYIQHSVHLLELNEIKTHQSLDNVNDPKYKKVDDVFVLKKKNLFKIVVPFSLRRKILQNAHEQFGHPGTQKMINLITPQYYWPHINLDISKFVKHCNVCQLNKRKRQKRFGLLQTVPPRLTF
ncbi:hypothetical protein TNCV_2345631 [Trichonephila clavipes]|nr:hypothetical protein TNCV_2345631 [Trichonephila clavipes]